MEQAVMYSVVMICAKSVQAPMLRYCRENPVKYSLLSAARVSIHRDTDERATHRSPPRAAAETKLSKAQASPEPAAQTPAKAQVYPGHSKAKEPVADQPLPQADVPPASQRTSTELTSQEGDEQVRVAGNCCSSRPEFAVTVRRSYVSWGTAVVFGQSSPRPYAAPLPLSAFINVYSSRGIAVVPGQNSP
ncbi:hypothetical protein NQ315_006123 [Exocentrus adspersus]|uniref:Uncharacterized protein n=1 Tax=Exocentrus adspersus TaxID=1586481 RepID=A0AAV8VD73_9CUCU|nr:hypothetical protein NQ315_006123 [Exocentrus adspersus]